MHEEGLVSALVDAALYDELNIDATEGKFVNRAHVDENSPRHQKLRLDLKNVVTTRWDLWDRTGPSAFSLNQRISSEERSLRGRVCYCTKFCHCYDDPKQPRINLPRIF